MAPKTRIIPAKELSSLLNASEILNHIKADVEKHHLEIAKESEKVKEHARQEGFEEGFKEWAEHIARLEQEIVNVRQDLEKTVLSIALRAAKKIVGREIELSEKTIIDIVSVSLKAVSQHKKIIIYVNKKDLEILEKYKTQLKELFEHLESLSIREKKEIEPGDCIIETEGGIINARMENKWKVLEEAFQTLMRKRELQNS